MQGTLTYVKIQDCNTCCKEDSQNVAEEPKKEVAPMSTENQICLLTCFDKKPECGETAVSAMKTSRYADSYLRISHAIWPLLTQSLDT